ncbi:hypothetical protein ACYOEI_16185, partial [Singulisphaera rosea]
YYVVAVLSPTTFTFATAPSQPAISGQTAAGANVFVTSGIANPVSLLTDANGHANFYNLPKGQWYQVKIWDKQPGFIPITGALQQRGDDGSLTTYVEITGDDKNQLFTYQKTGLIQGQVVRDLDATGTRVLADPGIPGVMVYLDDNNNNKYDPGEAHVLTNSDGSYQFLYNFPSPGASYKTTVRYVLPDALSANSATSFPVSIDHANPWATDDDFLLIHPVTLSGVVFDDLNGNGQQDPGEPGLPGVVVNITDTTASGTSGQPLGALPAGTYQIRFQAAQRGNGGGNQDFKILVNGTVVDAKVTPTGTAYKTYITPAFAMPAGTPTITFQGLDDAGGDNTAFIDDIAIVATVVSDAGFDQPSVGTGNFQYNPTGTPWTFLGHSGVSANNSAFTNGNPPAPEGDQVAFLQDTGTITQTTTTLAAGIYQLRFQAAQRANAGSRQDFQVLIDGVVVADKVTPTGGSYQTVTTAALHLAAGTHVITFKGLDDAGGDNTAFLDDVALIVPAPDDQGFEQPTLAPGTFKQAPPGTSWSFSSTSGISSNNSPFTAGNPAAPEGTQVVYLQGTSSFSQVIGVTSVVTDAQGYWSAQFRTPDTYRVAVHAPAGVAVTNSAPTYSVDTSQRTDFGGLSFGLTGVATPSGTGVSGVLFSDLNSNGIHDPGEPGLPGYTVELTGIGGRQTTTSGSLNNPGEFHFTSASDFTFLRTLLPSNASGTTPADAPTQFVPSLDLGSLGIAPGQSVDIRVGSLQGNPNLTDVAVFTGDKIILRLAKADGTSTVTSIATGLKPGTAPGSNVLLLADINGDHLVDLVAAANGGVVVVLSDGFGRFEAPVHVLGTQFAGKDTLLSVDNSTSPPTFYSADTSASGTNVYSFTWDSAAGKPTPPKVVTAPPALTDMALGDFNGDGITDLALFTQGNTLQIDLGPAFTTKFVSVAAPPPKSRLSVSNLFGDVYSQITYVAAVDATHSTVVVGGLLNGTATLKASSPFTTSGGPAFAMPTSLRGGGSLVQDVLVGVGSDVILFTNPAAQFGPNFALVEGPRFGSSTTIGTITEPIDTTPTTTTTPPATPPTSVDATVVIDTTNFTVTGDGDDNPHEIFGQAFTARVVNGVAEFIVQGDLSVPATRITTVGAAPVRLVVGGNLTV